MEKLEEKILNLQRDFQNQRYWMIKVQKNIDEYMEKLSINFERLAAFNNYKAVNKFVCNKCDGCGHEYMSPICDSPGKDWTCTPCQGKGYIWK